MRTKDVKKGQRRSEGAVAPFNFFTDQHGHALADDSATTF
jgi:hypothetical protein